MAMSERAVLSTCFVFSRVEGVVRPRRFDVPVGIVYVTARRNNRVDLCECKI